MKDDWGVNDPIVSNSSDDWGANDPVFTPTAPVESSYGDVLSKAATNAKLGLMQAVGGGMQAVGEAPVSAVQTLSQPAPTLPQNPSISDYISNYATYPIKQGLAKAEIAASAVPAAIAPNVFDNLAQSGKQIQQEATTQQQENQPNVAPGSFKGKVGQAAQMGLQLAPTLLAAGVAPESIPALFGAQGFGSTYAEQTNAGKTGGEALLPSVASGVANTAIGEIPLGVLTSEGGSLGSKLLKASIAGEVTSQGLNAVQQGINKGTIDPNMTWDQFKQSAQDIGGIGAALGMGGAGLAHPLAKAEITTSAKKVPINDASGNPTPDKAFNQSTGRMEDIGGNQPEQASPVAPVQVKELSPATDIDTAKTTLDAVKTGDLDNVHPDVLNDLAKSGEIQINDGGKPALTDLGNKLLDEINNLPPSDQNVTPQSATQELPTPANANGEDKLLSFTNETAPEAAPLVSDFAEKRLRDLWIEHDALPSDSPLRKSIIDEMDSIVQESPVFQNMKGLSKIGDEKPTPIVTEEATPEEQKAQEDYQVEKSDIPFKATESNSVPTERFAAQQDNIKGKLNNIIKRINPDVKTEFADKLFGEGEAIKASGGDSTGRQEVAGSYNKAENLIKASLNVDKWDVADTAYHEAYHSIRDMVKPEDDVVLKKAFPGTDKLAQTEHEAVEFGRFMTQKNATGFAPAVRRIFSAIRQALRDIGRTFKLGKFNSVEDIFNRAERGSVYKDYQDAIRSGDVESLKNISSGEQYKGDGNKFTEAFKKWFGDSKVVDKNGEPLTVYHGTNQSFDNFSKERLGSSTKTVSSDVGFWFSDSAKTSSEYADYAASRVISDINAHEKKLADLQKKLASAEKKQDWNAAERLYLELEDHELGAIQEGEKGANVMPVYLSIKDPKYVENSSYQTLSDMEKIISSAKNKGHDGVIFRQTDDTTSKEVSDHYVVFDPKQIKSIHNRGTYDPNDPRILYKATEDGLTPEQQEQAVKEVSPALHDVVYKAMSEDDEQALHNLNVEAHGTTEEKATAIGNDVYGRLGNAVNKGLDSAESAKEKMLRGGLELAKPFIGEKTYKQAQRRTEAAIAKTKRNATSLNIRRTTADVAQIVMSSNDGHLRAIAARTKSPTVESLADTLHPDPGHAKGLPRGYHEEIAHFTNKTLSQVARILHDTIEQKDKDAVRNYMTNPSSMTAEAVKNDPNARAAGHLSHMIQEMRDHLAAAGYEVPQTEGFYPRIYDNSSIVNNESAFKKDAVKAYYDTYKEDFQSMYDAMKSSHARDLNEQRTQERLLAENGVHASEKPYGKRTNDELQLAREKRLDNVNSKYLDADGNLIPYKDFVLRFVKDRVEAWYNNILLQDDGITSDPNGYFKNVSTIPDAPSSFRQRVLSKAADDILSNWMVKDPLSAMNKLAIQTGRKAGWEKFFGGDKLNQLHQGMIKDGLNGTDIGHVMDILRSNTGQLGGSINRQVKNALALSRYWTAVRFLTKAPFKHLSISLNAGAHTGNPANAWRTLVDSTHALFKTDKSQAMRIYAELAGITGESAEHAMLLNQSGMMSDNEKINFMSNAYYDAVGMTKFIGAHKVGMQRSIQYMLADLADDIVNRKNGWKSAEFMMKNYPVPENEVQGFAQWIKDNGGRDINNSITLGNSKYADMYRASSQRATDQIISNPTAATRQMYASHPLASLIYQLSAYHMTAMKNSLQRNARLFAEGVTGKNYDMRDRLRLVAPLTMYLPAMTLFMYGYNKSKDALFPPDQPDKTNTLAKSVVDADLFGQFNFLAKDIVGSKYLQNKLGYYYHDWDARKSTAEKAYDMLGPDFSMFKDYAKMIGNISDNMSTNSRKKDAELKSEYSNIVAPIFTSFIANYVPFALPAFLTIQAINHPAIRRAVTKAVK